jgi:hypothetical protein
VGDHKPPRLVGDERSTLTELLDFQRQSLVRKLDGLTESQARWSPVPTGTSLLWLVKHMTRAEALWVRRRFAGLDEGPEADYLDRGDSVGSVIAAYHEQWEAVDDIVAAHRLDEIAADLEGQPPVDLRWILAHLLEETARHAGHADLIREQIDGATGR